MLYICTYIYHIYYTYIYTCHIYYINIYIYISHLLYPFIYSWTLRLLPYLGFLAIINNAAINIGVHMSFWTGIFIFFFSFLRFYLCIWERERAWAGRGAEGEADSLLSREPDIGLYPRTLGSWPEAKADTWLTEPHRCPGIFIFFA